MSSPFDLATVRKGWSFGGYQSNGAPGAIIRARCADGKVRHATVTAYADSYWTLPARVSVKGKTVSGHVYLHDSCGDSPEIRFTPYGWRKNHSMLPDWKQGGAA